jgi:hypothetical protein
MSSAVKDTLADPLYKSAADNPLPGFKSATGLDYPAVLEGLAGLYGSLDRLFSTPLRRARPLFDLERLDSDD